ncbi:hypothetical protein C8J57DRAFT_1294459, partial [Mycena rebaudengoi]
MPPGSAGERQHTSHGPAPTRSRAPAGFVGSQIRDATRSVRRPPFYQAHVCASAALNALPRRGAQSLPDPVAVCMPAQCCTSRTCVSFSRRVVAARLQSPGVTTSAQLFAQVSAIHTDSARRNSARSSHKFEVGASSTRPRLATSHRASPA